MLNLAVNLKKKRIFINMKIIRHTNNFRSSNPITNIIKNIIMNHRLKNLSILKRIKFKNNQKVMLKTIYRIVKIFDRDEV